LPFIGSAPNKTFQRTDGTRTGSQTWQEADAAGVDIVSNDHDTHDQDLADGISACFLRDGGNTATANLPMGGFRFTNLGDATALNQALTAKQSLNNAVQYCSVGGSANTVTLLTGFSASSYTAGMTVSWVVATTNTGAVTINVDSLGAKALVRADGAHTALVAGDLPIGALVEAQYDGTRFQLRSPATTSTSADVLARIVKAGTIVAWAHSTVPAGWLECYGQAISRTTYAELFSAIGTTYGTGDGSSTFNLPDMRGRCIFGEDDMGGSSADRITSAGAGFDGDTLGATGGSETVTLARANLPNVQLQTDAKAEHWHEIYGDLSVNNTAGGGSGERIQDLLNGPSGANDTGRTSTEPAHFHTTESINGNVTQTSVNKMPPAIILKWIILALPAAASASTLGVHGLQYTWNTATSGDPGSGKLLVNNGTLSSATSLNISETDNVAADVSAFLATWDDSTSTINGFIHISKVGAPGTFAIFSTSGSLTDSGGYDTFTVAHIASAGTLANGDSVSVLFYRTGDQGEDGPPGGGFPFAFDDGTTDADPGSGNLRFNNADIASATQIFISTDTSAASDITDYLDALDDSSSVNRGTIQISKTIDPGVYALFTAGVVTTASGYRKIAVTYVDHSGTFTDGDVIAFNFSRSGDKGDTGADGTDAGILWAFDDSTTTNADPGTGDIRLNNASFASVTEIAISYSNAESGNPSVEAYVKSWDDSTTTGNRGALIIKKKGSAENFAIYAITSAITDGTTYGRFTLSHVVSNGGFTAADVLSVQFFRSGDKGTDGAGTGDVVGPASAVVGNIATFSNVSGKEIDDSGIAILDEDDFSSDSATGVPTQQSTKAYIAATSQPLDGGLTDIAGLAVTDGNIIVGNGTNWVAESGATARASLGVAIGIDVQAYDAQLDEWATVDPSDDGKSLVSAADFASMRTLLGIEPLTPERYGAVGDCIRIDDAAITSSDSTLTSASDPFTADDVGKHIVVVGAGAAGVPLQTTIASFTGAGEVELADAAATTVSDAVSYFGTDDGPALRSMAAAGIAGTAVYRLREGASYLVATGAGDDITGVSFGNFTDNVTVFAYGSKIVGTDAVQGSSAAASLLRFFPDDHAAPAYPKTVTWYGGEICLEACTRSTPGGHFIGGMSIGYVHTRLKDIVFNHGTSTPDSAAIGVGGGDQSIYLPGNLSAIVDGCVFIGSPDQGVYIDNQPAADSRFVKVKNCHFYRNARGVGVHGGAEKWIVEGCTFIENEMGVYTPGTEADSGGGGIVANNIFQKTQSRCVELRGNAERSLVFGNIFEDFGCLISTGGTYGSRSSAVRMVAGQVSKIFGNTFRMVDWTRNSTGGQETCGVELMVDGANFPSTTGNSIVVEGNSFWSTAIGVVADSGVSFWEERNNQYIGVTTPVSNGATAISGINSRGTYANISSGLPNMRVLPNGQIVRTSDILTLTPQSVTIASGVATIGASRVVLDTESAAASDDLDTIDAGTEVDGMVVILSTANSSRDVVIKYNTGNILTATGVDVTLTGSIQRIAFEFRATHWIELFRSF
jgi:microcystin-dependent protein